MLCFLIVVVSIFLLVACSSNDNVLTEENAISESNLNKQLLNLKKEVEYYKNQNLKLQEIIDNLNKLNEEKPIRLSRVGGLCYISLLDNEKVRYIDTSIELKALPFDDAPSINIIRENTLVSVTDKISNTGNYDDYTTLWYYVTIPVHDTPMDCRGWIKYKQTSIYDKEKKKTLQGEVGIRVGAKYSEDSSLPDFKDNDSLPICDYTIGGRIVDQLGDYVQLECAGGKMCWVNNKNLIYPEIP